MQQSEWRRDLLLEVGLEWKIAPEPAVTRARSPLRQQYGEMRSEKPQEKAINDFWCNRTGRYDAGSELAEPSKTTDIDLGRSPLIDKLEEVRRDAVHLMAESPAAEPPEHSTISKIEIEHAPPNLARREILRQLGKHQILCGGEPADFVERKGTRGPRRHIIRPATYVRITLERFLNQQASVFMPRRMSVWPVAIPHPYP